MSVLFYEDFNRSSCNTDIGQIVTTLSVLQNVEHFLNTPVTLRNYNHIHTQIYMAILNHHLLFKRYEEEKGGVNN